MAEFILHNFQYSDFFKISAKERQPSSTCERVGGGLNFVYPFRAVFFLHRKRLSWLIYRREPYLSFCSTEFVKCPAFFEKCGYVHKTGQSIIEFLSALVRVHYAERALGGPREGARWPEAKSKFVAVTGIASVRNLRLRGGR